MKVTFSFESFNAGTTGVSQLSAIQFERLMEHVTETVDALQHVSCTRHPDAELLVVPQLMPTRRAPVFQNTYYVCCRHLAKQLEEALHQDHQRTDKLTIFATTHLN